MGLGDKISNSAEDAKGKAKESFGKATGDSSTEAEAEGKMDQLKAGVKDAGEKVKDTVKDVFDKYTRTCPPQGRSGSAEPDRPWCVRRSLFGHHPRRLCGHRARSRTGLLVEGLTPAAAAGRYFAFTVTRAARCFLSTTFTEPFFFAFSETVFALLPSTRTRTLPVAQPPSLTFPARTRTTTLPPAR
jgi:uncharacterized protein YjbJ (UPF0337 family)